MTDPVLPDPINDVLFIADELTIPLAELSFRFSRASGPGGQHIQRSESRVELLFDVAHSPSLTEAQRQRLFQRLAGTIDGAGVLRIVSAATRSQLANRAAAQARFQALLAAALRKRKRRLPTRPTTASRERRLAEKRTQAETKRGRRRIGAHEYD